MGQQVSNAGIALHVFRATTRSGLPLWPSPALGLVAAMVTRSPTQSEPAGLAAYSGEPTVSLRRKADVWLCDPSGRSAASAKILKADIGRDGQSDDLLS